MERYFISDTHFGHTNIIKYCCRPFSSAPEMDEFMIARWNETVKPQDHISHIGDVTMARGGRVQQNDFIRLIGRLNGHKRLYLGNHDHFPIQTYLDAGFEKVYATWRDEQGLLFSHIPIHPTALGSVKGNIHGHTHANKSPTPAVFVDRNGKTWVKPYINICVEQTGYRPLQYDEVMERVRVAVEEALPKATIMEGGGEVKSGQTTDIPDEAGQDQAG